MGLVERTLGHKHPLMAEVLECYSDLLIRANRSAEGRAMKNRSEAIWRAYGARPCRTHIQDDSVPSYCADDENSLVARIRADQQAVFEMLRSGESSPGNPPLEKQKKLADSVHRSVKYRVTSAACRYTTCYER